MCYPSFESFRFRFAGLKDEIVESVLVDNGHALRSTKGVHNADTLFIIIQSRYLRVSDIS